MVGKLQNMKKDLQQYENNSSNINDGAFSVNEISTLNEKLNKMKKEMEYYRGKSIKYEEKLSLKKNETNSIKEKFKKMEKEMEHYKNKFTEKEEEGPSLMKKTGKKSKMKSQLNSVILNAFLFHFCSTVNLKFRELIPFLNINRSKVCLNNPFYLVGMLFRHFKF